MPKEKKRERKREITVPTKTNKKFLLITFSKTCSFSSYFLFEVARVFLSIHMQSRAWILVILCLLFLLALGLYRYPSRLISHCQGSCPIGKFSSFFQFFQILPLTVKTSGIFYCFFIPFYVSSFYCFFLLLYMFSSLSSCCSYYL